MKYHHIFRPVYTAIITQRAFAFFLFKYRVFIILYYTRALHIIITTPQRPVRCILLTLLLLYKREHIAYDNDNGFSLANIMRHRAF